MTADRHVMSLQFYGSIMNTSKVLMNQSFIYLSPSSVRVLEEHILYTILRFCVRIAIRAKMRVLVHMDEMNTLPLIH